MTPSKKPACCPIAEELAAIEKMNQNFDKRLAKDAAACSKQLLSTANKIKKLYDTKSKALAKKKAVADKIKVKSTAPLKAQIEKATIAATKANDALTAVKEEVAGLKIVNQKCTKLIKRRQVEAKLITQFRKDEEKKEAQKIKNKSKPKAKAKPAKKKPEPTKTEEK